jgi:hypothetical protein
MSVDLPEPDEPMIATNSPDWTVRLIPRSASTLTSPRIKVRATFSTLMTGCVTSEPSRGIGAPSQRRGGGDPDWPLT